MMSFNPAEQGQQQSGQQAYQAAPVYQPGQLPPWQQGHQGRQPQGQPAYNRPESTRRSPVSSATLSTWLLLGTVAAGLLAWLLSLFGAPAVSIEFGLGAGLLGLVVLLPGEDKAPKLLPFVAVFATLAGLLGIRTVVGAGFGVPTAIGVVVFVLIVLEMLAAVGAVLFEYNMVQLPAPGTAGPAEKAARAPQPGRPQPGQPYAGRPEQAQPQPGHPQQGAAGAAQPVWMTQSTQAGYQPQSQAGAVGNFDPSQFESGAFQPAAGRAPADTAPADPSRAPQPQGHQPAGDQAYSQQAYSQQTQAQQAQAQQTQAQQAQAQQTQAQPQSQQAQQAQPQQAQAQPQQAETEEPRPQGTRQFTPLDGDD